MILCLSCEEQTDIIAIATDSFYNSSNYTVETVSTVAISGVEHTAVSRLTVFKKPYKAKFETDTITLYIDENGAYFVSNGEWVRILSTSDTYELLYRVMSQDGNSKIFEILNHLSSPHSTVKNDKNVTAFVNVEYSRLRQYIEDIYLDMELDEETIDALLSEFVEEDILDITVSANNDLTLTRVSVNLTDVMKLADTNIDYASNTYNVISQNTAESFVIPKEALTAKIAG